MSSNGSSLNPDPNSDSRKLSCRSETAVYSMLKSLPVNVRINKKPEVACFHF